jgi:threonine/homoserine/homoserine lactone efflux protein
LITVASAAGMALVALGIVLTPGPNMIYLVSRSISQGRVAGLISLTGTVAGFGVYMTLANLGLGGVFLTMRWLYDTVRLAGAAYLLYLAWQAIRPGGLGLFETRCLPRDTAPKLFRMGLLTNLLNPKAAIMYLALIPQFVSPDRGHVLMQGFVLGGIQVTVSAAVNATIILAAAGIAVCLGTRPAWLRWQRRVTAILLAAVGVTLALGT